jgi:hypothetical protein
MKFKEKPQGEVYFGCEQDKYYHVGAVEKYVSSSVISLLRRAATGMYQSHGEDPSKAIDEPERPAVVFPLWVMDQLIVTPEGEEPPCLCDPQFSTYGMTKSDDRQAMKDAIDSLDFAPGKTYTFGFWCIAQFVDAIGWKAPARGVLPETPLDGLGTHPPCYITMYSLKPREQWAHSRGTNDQRHLDSRKEYLFRTAFWSSLLPPDERRRRQLTAPPSPVKKQRRSASPISEGGRTSWRAACCGGFSL